MRHKISHLVFTSSLVGLMGCQMKPTHNANMDVKEEKTSYAIGLDIGKRMKEQNIELKIDAFVNGLEDGLNKDAKPKLDEKGLNQALSDFRNELMEKRKNQMEVDKKKNEEEAKAFLEENKKKPNIKTTESGLQYEVLTEGSGDSPKATDRVKTHYKGTLINGTEFDSSYSRNEPATFPLQGVIKGWTEALQLMKPGAKWKIFLPPELGYGERGSPPKIGPQAALIFEIELLEILAEPKTEAPEAPAAKAQTKPAEKKGKK